MTEPSQEFESILEDYPVHLQNFEGPLDLLLHLIKKHEVNIYDIPIALVTQQYLDYLDLMQELNLDVVGEFLVMAATLIHIKSRMLLPRPDPTQDDPEEDPREALVRRLHRASAVQGRRRAAARARDSAQRAVGAGPTTASPTSSARRRSRRSKSICSASWRRSVRCSSARSSGRASCCRPSRCRSRRASSSCSRGCRRPTPAASRSCSPTCRRAAGMVVTFLALLEMIRLKLVRVFQQANFGPIRVYKREQARTARRRSITEPCLI